jgi:hypothetical protein
VVHSATLRSLRKWEAIHIEWVDIYSDDGASAAKKWVEEFKPCVRKSIGYFLGMREIDGITWLFVCNTDDRSAEREDGAEKPDAEHFNAFPVAVIVSLDRMAAKNGAPKRQ